jgi:predicted O-methyltransferase YrrM
LRHRVVSVLEVGAFEGRSAVAFLEYLPHASVTTIDTFPDPPVEARFDANVASYGERLTKVKGRALGALERLKAKNVEFDVVYLDAAKRRSDAFAHSAAAWPLLAIGGILIWDDLAWHPEDPPANRPEPGIRLFCDAFGDCMEIIHEGWQMIVRKRAEWPEEEPQEQLARAS